MSIADKPAHERAREGWQSAEEASKYSASRKPGAFHRFQQEEKIVRKWLADVPSGGLIIDVPCGTGRWAQSISDQGFRYVGGDVSLFMIHEARKTAEGVKHVLGFSNADAGRLPFNDNVADCVLLWRLLHHILDEKVRHAMLKEAARVSKRKVLVSFHHSLSFTMIRKYIGRTFFGKKFGPAITHWQLKREAEACGLEMVETAGFRKYISVNWFACFVKR